MQKHGQNNEKQFKSTHTADSASQNMIQVKLKSGRKVKKRKSFAGQRKDNQSEQMQNVFDDTQDNGQEIVLTDKGNFCDLSATTTHNKILHDYHHHTYVNRKSKQSS